MSDISNDIAQILSPLRLFVERIATVRSPTEKFYSCFLSASLVKAFDFVDLVSNQQSDEAYFLAPALRGITEDIIYLHFLSRFSHEIREQVLYNMIQLEVEKQLSVQNSFFKKFRPFQPILPLATTDTRKMEEQLRSFWKENGLKWGKKMPPSTRKIAEKSGSVPLHIVYDFIYRFTSGMVHFNPQMLLRSGWGHCQEEITFSTRNMDNYYLEISLIYGSFLLCLYFEFFDRFLCLNQKEKNTVGELREYLLWLPRWPEMVTFEEMNFDVPETEMWPAALIHAMFSAVSRDGFISGAEEIINRYESRKSRSGKGAL